MRAMTASTQAPTQRELFPCGTKQRDAGFVNDRVTLRTSDGQRVVLVDGLPVHHYSTVDGTAEAYAMVTLVEGGFADQNDVARVFGYSVRTIRRYEERYDQGGIAALGRTAGRPAGTRSRKKIDGRRDGLVLGLKTEGLSNREIARRLGISETAVRKRVKRSGWVSPQQQRNLFEDDVQDAPLPDTHSASASPRSTDAAAAPARSATNPLDRTIDRLFARLGLLDDAEPIFAPSASVPRAGVLLAIPGIVASGVVDAARVVYGERALAPAFYGLRTTIVALVLLVLLRIKRPEALKEHAPAELGRLLGLDRAPEVKTLRKKLELLARQGGAERFGRELAQRRVAERGRMLGFLYVDGHVRVYHGRHRIPKAHVPQLRLAVPGTTDYYVNDKQGEPLFVVTAEANAGMVKMLLQLTPKIRALVGEKRRPTIVFDRGGWSPKLFAQLLEQRFDVLTYRKGRIDKIAERLFKDHAARIGDRKMRYRLHDTRVALLGGDLRLRQVTRLTEGGHQTSILTSRLDLKAIEVAYRMFERWRQENFFKYMREEFAIDALAEHAAEPDDPTRTVPNPARRAMDDQVATARAAEGKLAQEYGHAAIDNPEAVRPTARGFKIAHGKLGHRLRVAREQLAELQRQRAALPERVPVGVALGGTPVVKLATERQHLTTVLKMVAYQIESDLLGLLRPHYARVDEEGRTLVQTAIQSAAALAPGADRLEVTIASLSSQHRSKAVSAVCAALNKPGVAFPGTTKVMHFGVAGGPDEAQKADKSEQG
ncbi:MAG: putative transposase [Burkholderiales bacterium]